MGDNLVQQSNAVVQDQVLPGNRTAESDDFHEWKLSTGSIRNAS